MEQIQLRTCLTWWGNNFCVKLFWNWARGFVWNLFVARYIKVACAGGSVYKVFSPSQCRSVIKSYLLNYIWSNESFICIISFDCVSKMIKKRKQSTCMVVSLCWLLYTDTSKDNTDYTMRVMSLDWQTHTLYRSIKKVNSLRNISKVFFTFLLYIDGLCFTIHVIKFSCHFVSINHTNI